MIVEKVDPTRETFKDYSLEGAVLTIGELAVDLEGEQGEQEVIIAFSTCEGVIHRGLMPCGEYVAEVIIPPRRYETVEVKDTAAAASGEAEEGGPETRMESIPVPLDRDTVKLKLWPAAARSENIPEGEK
jgi:hypothetical protein